MNFSAGSLSSKSPNYRPKYDDRKGLGYGILEPKFHKNRNANSTFPYKDKDEHQGNDDHEMSDEEVDRFVKKINGKYQPVDPLKKNDPFYNFAGNTPARSLAAEAMAVNSKSMSPLPRSYSGSKKAAAVSGGTSPLPFPGPTLGFRTSIRPTGTKKGFSSAPAPMDDIMSVTDTGLYSPDDVQDKDEKHVKDLRKLVRHILKGNLYAQKG